MRIYLIGHMSPDLDAIASPIAYAEFLRKYKRYEGSELIPVIAGEPNPETLFVFDTFDVKMPPNIEDFEINKDDYFILVDHHEESQRHPLVTAENILEILDHHRVNLSFITPLRVDVKPMGSTSTLVYEHFKTQGIIPSQGTMGILFAAILSDTQGLRSSTTTGYDAEYANEISENLNIELNTFIYELFKAKSDIRGLTPEQISTKDYKLFDFKEHKVFINQVETVEPETIINEKQALVEALNGLKTKFDADMAITVVTDIIKVNSFIIYAGPEENIIEKAFNVTAKENLADIGPRMSRKKDIAPAIERVL